MKIAILVLPLMLSLAFGCSPSGPVPVASTGIVKTKSGSPCDNALVVFHPLDGSRVNDPKPVAKTDSEGRFVLRTFSESDGAIPGEYAVTVVWPGKAGTGTKISMTGEGEVVGADQLKGKFGDPNKPLLNATIPSKGITNILLVVD